MHKTQTGVLDPTAKVCVCVCVSVHTCIHSCLYTVEPLFYTFEGTE
jgi:hypothetical protein